jgi:hypothetical protein
MLHVVPQPVDLKLKPGELFGLSPYDAERVQQYFDAYYKSRDAAKGTYVNTSPESVQWAAIPFLKPSDPDFLARQFLSLRQIFSLEQGLFRFGTFKNVVDFLLPQLAGSVIDIQKGLSPGLIVLNGDHELIKNRDIIRRRLQEEDIELSPEVWEFLNKSVRMPPAFHGQKPLVDAMAMKTLQNGFSAILLSRAGEEKKFGKFAKLARLTQAKSLHSMTIDQLLAFYEVHCRNDASDETWKPLLAAAKSCNKDPLIVLIINAAEALKKAKAAASKQYEDSSDDSDEGGRSDEDDAAGGVPATFVSVEEHLSTMALSAFFKECEVTLNKPEPDYDELEELFLKGSGGLCVPSNAGQKAGLQDVLQQLKVALLFAGRRKGRGAASAASLDDDADIGEFIDEIKERYNPIEDLKDLLKNVKASLTKKEGISYTRCRNHFSNIYWAWINNRNKHIETIKNWLGSSEIGVEAESAMLFRACQKSAPLKAFLGYFDRDLRLCFEPFHELGEGNLKPYLNALPEMAHALEFADHHLLADDIFSILDELGRVAKTHPHVLHELGLRVKIYGFEDLQELKNSQFGSTANNLTSRDDEYIKKLSLLLGYYGVVKDMLHELRNFRGKARAKNEMQKRHDAPRHKKNGPTQDAHNIVIGEQLELILRNDESIRGIVDIDKFSSDMREQVASRIKKYAEGKGAQKSSSAPKTTKLTIDILKGRNDELVAWLSDKGVSGIPTLKGKTKREHHLFLNGELLALKMNKEEEMRKTTSATTRYGRQVTRPLGGDGERM